MASPKLKLNFKLPRRLGLIIWKNLLLRKRQWVVSFFEVLFSIFMAIIIYLWFMPRPQPDYSYGSGGHYVDHEQIFVIDESKLQLSDCNSNASNPDPETKNFIAFAPNTTGMTKIIKELVHTICHEDWPSQITGASTLGYVGVLNDAELETKFNTEWKHLGNFKGAVVFPDELAALEKFPSTNVATYTIRLKPGVLYSTNTLFPPKGHPDYYRTGANEKNKGKYLESGFLGLQWHLDRIISKKLNVQQKLSHSVSVTPFPYPTVKREFDYDQAYAMTSIYIVIAWCTCFLIPSITRNVVGEKQTGIAELLRLTGVPGWIQWIGWLIHVAIPQLFVIISLTIIMCAMPFTVLDKPMINRGDPSLLAFILILHMLASIGMGFLVCALFQKPSIATGVGVLLCLISMIAGALFVSTPRMYNYFEVRIGLSVFPNFALAQVWANLVRWEDLVDDESDKPYGLRWSCLTTDEAVLRKDENSVVSLYAILFLLFEAIFYSLLAVYLDGVLPSEHGVRRPWTYFDFQFKRGRKQAFVTPVMAPLLPPAPSAPELKQDASTAAGTKEPAVASTKESAVANIPSESVAAKSNQELQLAFVSSFEPEPAGAPVGIEIQNMYKKFGPYKIAVNGVSLRMFTGDIFALLGHNGAGKTTLISMLTGFFSPSAGTAFINGYDIRTNLGNARESMGLCPQHNMLFEKLTCGEQLILFGMLRGLTCEQAKTEMKMLLYRMNIYDKMDTLASKLSGGQKRKLSLGIALIGGTKVVVLDEPTSGMDPQARREIWDLLLQLRGQRTILLTTHFMEEADVLGDRIGIMANGQLQCCGSSSFLKKFYGTGYTLKLTLSVAAFVVDTSKKMEVDNVSASPSQQGQATDLVPQDKPMFKPSPASAAILSAVQKYVPNADFKTDARVDHASNEVFLCLPTDTATTSALSHLFVDLTGRKDKLEIKTVGLSQTSMDEVFVKVGELGHPQQHNPEMDEETIQKSPKAKKGIFIGQFLSLLMKMLTYSMRKWILLIFQVVIPFAFFLLAIHLANEFAKPVIQTGYSTTRSAELSDPSSSLSHKKLTISLNSYDSNDDSKPVTFFSGDMNLASVLVYGKSVKNVSTELLAVGEADRISYKRRYIVAAELTNSTSIQTLYNLYPYHSAPLALNIISNFLLNVAQSNIQIQVANHPFDGESAKPEQKNENNYDRSVEESNSASARDGGDKYYTQEFERNTTLYNFWQQISFLTASTFPLGLILLVANFVVQPIEEKLCKAKQLQTMTGVSPMVYWGASFTFDFGIYIVLILIMFGYLLFADLAIGYNVFTPNGGWFVFLVLCLAYGYSSILFCYLVSLRASSVTGGYALVMLVQLFVGLFFGFLPDKFKEVCKTDALYDTFKFLYLCLCAIGRCFPSYSFVRGFWYYAHVSASNSACPLLSVDPKKCPDPLPYWAWYTLELASHCEEGTSGSSSSGGPGDYDYNGYRSNYKHIPYMRTNPGILREVFFMMFVGSVYLFWLMLVEYKIFRKSRRQLALASDMGSFPPNMYDEDVWLEAARVNELIATRQMLAECLVVRELSKNYGDFAAVSNLHFGVHNGECFGLLGVNGAGKTTAFRMITGDEIPAKGNAYGFGTGLEADPNRFFGNIGYCPQFEAQLEHFTGKEMLQLFAGLRGVPFKMRANEALRWLRRMGLSESANVKCGRYSGGMKRRLSTAMAMIGDPALILLDEPTTGVDPVSRRQFWSIMDKLRASGQSIILTSHSMEECEALCSRLGIMVNGQFQCFGGVQHLKNKFAQGYSLTIKLKQDLAFDSQEIKAQVQEFEGAISEKFKPCELKDKHQNLMNFHLQNPSITWDALFKSMEDVKNKYVNLIEDYSVNETSLEEVFLAFARMQYPERKAGVSLCKQICTCSC